jgi:hypothetical protein
MKVTVFCYVTRMVLYEVTNVSEELAAYIVRVDDCKRQIIFQ